MRAGLAAVALLLVPATAAAPPRAGVFDPGRSLGGVRLGMTAAQVRATWGSGYAVCRGCEHRTWYYNYAPFSPQGAGVELRGGRVVAVFTLSSPSGWRTTRGLTLGDAAARITAVYGATNRADCGAYYALLLPRGRTVSAFYVVKDRLWAFALLRSPSPPCR